MALISFNAQAMRIKDVANVSGVRSNQLIGYGLVVGLDGTGDQVTQTPYTNQSISNMLGYAGVTMSPEQMAKMQSKNVAAVIVSAQLPPYVKAGQAIDITVSSIGNAKSLKGGVLVMTPLKGADSQVYAIGQGSVTVANAKTGQVSGIVNNGALVEREVAMDLGNTEYIAFELKRTDFTLISKLKNIINREFGIEIAKTVDGRIIQIRTAGFQIYDLIARIESLEVPEVEGIAKVTIHSKTGAIVMTKDVKVSECAVTHGSISIQVGDSTGTTGNTMSFPKSAKLNDLVKAFNSMGVSAADMVSIIQAMSAAGALNAELEIL